MKESLFFCGIGGSGMSALAAICARRGARVGGSDRGYDQGASPEKFAGLKALGITLYPQDGSGITPDLDALIISTAVEETIPDIAAAKKLNIPIRKRAELLASLLNAAPRGISIAGTSGKSTITGMLATILAGANCDPTVMNGGIIRNFGANMRAGQGDIFLAETDESDGTIALYNPAICVLNNITLDHKPLSELEPLFTDFIARTHQAAVLNFDDPKVKALAKHAKGRVISYALEDPDADLRADQIHLRMDGSDFQVIESGAAHSAHIAQPGRHNVLNALAALAASRAAGIALPDAITYLQSFTGIARRLEVVGNQNGITVFDDFGHNPDKIAATLSALRAFPGRLLVMFQPHGFGPLKLMGREIAQSFATLLGPEDRLFMPEAYYAGGTVDRSVSAKDVVAMVNDGGGAAEWFATRAEILPAIIRESQKGDRIIVMGARDDTLSDFAREILTGL